MRIETKNHVSREKQRGIKMTRAFEQEMKLYICTVLCHTFGLFDVLPLTLLENRPALNTCYTTIQKYLFLNANEPDHPSTDTHQIDFQPKAS